MKEIPSFQIIEYGLKFTYDASRVKVWNMCAPDRERFQKRIRQISNVITGTGTESTFYSKVFENITCL